MVFGVKDGLSDMLVWLKVAIFFVNCTPNGCSFVGRIRLDIIHEVDNNIVIFIKIIAAFFLFNASLFIILRTGQIGCIWGLIVHSVSKEVVLVHVSQKLSRIYFFIGNHCLLVHIFLLFPKDWDLFIFTFTNSTLVIAT